MTSLPAPPRMLLTRVFSVLVGLGLVLVACSNDSASTEECQELQQQLSEITTERDDLLAEKAVAEQRFAKSSAALEATGRIVSDPASYGSEEEVLDLLMEYVEPDAVIHDLAYGTISTRQGWKNTLFGGQVDAETYEWHNWMCADGSQGGSLWTWRGTNVVGEPFELIGIALTEYSDEGLEARQTVAWPYDYQHVYDEFGVGP